MSQFFTSGGQSIGASASASVILMNSQGYFLWDWLVWSPCSPCLNFEGPGPCLNFLTSIDGILIWFLDSSFSLSLNIQLNDSWNKVQNPFQIHGHLFKLFCIFALKWISHGHENSQIPSGLYFPNLLDHLLLSAPSCCLLLLPFQIFPALFGYGLSQFSLDLLVFIICLGYVLWLSLTPVPQEISSIFPLAQGPKTLGKNHFQNASVKSGMHRLHQVDQSGRVEKTKYLKNVC